MTAYEGQEIPTREELLKSEAKLQLALATAQATESALRPVVIDIKLVGEKSWKRRPHAKHILQVNGYAAQNDSPRWALLYVRGVTIFDAESPEVETDLFEGATSVELARELCETWLEVERHRRFRTLPPRVVDARRDRFPCGWCRHAERCAPPSEEEQ